MLTYIHVLCSFFWQNFCMLNKHIPKSIVEFGLVHVNLPICLLSEFPQPPTSTYTQHFKPTCAKCSIHAFLFELQLQHLTADIFASVTTGALLNLPREVCGRVKRVP